MHVEFAGMTTDNTKSIRAHSHSHWEILYYFSGSGTLRVGNEEIPFQPGDIICQPPDIPHSEYSENGFYNIFIQVSDFKIPRQGMIPRFKDTSNLDIQNIARFLYREFHLKRNSWNILVDELFQVLYRYMLSMNQGDVKNNYVKEFEDILVSNLSNPHFRIEDAQKKIHLSAFYLKRLFKKETGESPLEYLTTKRIEYSKQLLGTKYETSMSIKEIASLAGYDDPYYFSRVFKKVTGKSPSDWVSTYNLK
jgi:AraC-like DNA-binding protein